MPRGALRREHFQKQIPTRGKIPFSPFFFLKYKKAYTPDILKHTTTLRNPVLKLKAEQADERRVRRGLWWNVISPVSISQKSTVRNWSKRRLRTAFEAALEEGGFDKNGIKLSATNGGTVVSTSGDTEVELTGTLLIIGQLSTVTAKWIDLKKSFGKVVDYLMPWS